jgi:hypothetical protein
MTDPDVSTPGDAGAGQNQRPGFARLLRANLPGPLALAGYAVIAVVFHVVVHLSVPAAITLTILAAVAGIMIDTTVDYATPRPRHRHSERDDGAVSGDG